jgi:hypothetical protein
MIPLAWAAPTAEAVSQVMVVASRSGSRVTRAIRWERLSPCKYSITR